MALLLFAGDSWLIRQFPGCCHCHDDHKIIVKILYFKTKTLQTYFQSTGYCLVEKEKTRNIHHNPLIGPLSWLRSPYFTINKDTVRYEYKYTLHHAALAHDRFISWESQLSMPHYRVYFVSTLSPLCLTSRNQFINPG